MDIHVKFGISNLKLRQWYFWFSDFWSNSLVNKKSHDSGTSYNIYIKLEPVITIDKRNMATLQNLMMMTCGQIMTSSYFSVLWLTWSWSRIPNEWTIIFAFPLIATFHLRKDENRTKKSLTQFSYYCFE